MKQVQQDGLTYLINEKEEKAEIIGYYENRNNFLIPRSIKYESQEYIIRNISKDAFKIHKILNLLNFHQIQNFKQLKKELFSCHQLRASLFQRV